MEFFFGLFGVLGSNFAKAWGAFSGFRYRSEVRRLFVVVFFNDGGNEIEFSGRMYLFFLVLGVVVVVVPRRRWWCSHV